MNHALYFHPDAEVEVNETSMYLNNESYGLGEIFLDELQEALDLILSNPKIGPQIKFHVRAKVLSKFSYSIIYSIHG
jgi:toxin ParE1/3/4